MGTASSDKHVATPPSSRPTNVRWLVFVLGCGTSWMLYLHRYTFGLLKPKLQAEFGWSSTELGLLDSASSFCYSVFQVPAGILADLVGAHLFLVASIALWSLALGLVALAPNLAWMRLARAAFGGGQSGCYAALSRVTRRWFPLSVRTTVQGVMAVFCGRLGGVSANLLFASLLIGVLQFRWQTAIYLLASAGFALALAFLLLFRDAPQRHPWVNQAEVRLIEGTEAGAQPGPPRQRLSFADLFRRMRPAAARNVLALVLQSALSTVADSIYVSWIPLFLAQVHGLKYAEMGVFSMLPLLGGACGGVAGGFLNDLAIRRTGSRRWSRSLVGLTGKGVAGVLLTVSLTLYDQPYLFCGMLLFVKFFSDWSLTSTWGTITDIAGLQSATVFAFVNAVASLAEVPGAYMYGKVVDNYGWGPVFTIVIILYGLCAASWLLVDCTLPVLAESPVIGHAADVGAGDRDS